MTDEAEGSYEKLFETPPLSDDLARELGHVIAQWGLIESSLSHTIWILLSHLDVVGKAITAELTTMQRVTLIGSLIDCANKPQWSEVWDKIALGFNSIRNLRNDVAHGMWMLHEDGSSVSRIKAKGKVVNKNRIWREKDLKKLAEMENFLASSIFNLTVRMNMDGVPEILRTPPAESDEPRSRPPSRAAQLQDQVRAQKKARKDADRAASRAQKKSEPS